MKRQLYFALLIIFLIICCIYCFYLYKFLAKKTPHKDYVFSPVQSSSSFQFPLDYYEESSYHQLYPSNSSIHQPHHYSIPTYQPQKPLPPQHSRQHQMLQEHQMLQQTQMPQHTQQLQEPTHQQQPIYQIQQPIHQIQQPIYQLRQPIYQLQQPQNPQQPQQPQNPQQPQQPQKKFKQPLDPTVFMIITYNIRIDVDEYPHRWVDRQNAVVQNTLQYSPSIICLQEFVPSMKSYLVAAFPGWKWTGKYRSKKNPEGNPILFSPIEWSIIKDETYVFNGKFLSICLNSHCTDPTVFETYKSKHPRIFTAVWAVHTYSGEKYVFINTHFPLEPVLQHHCANQLLDFINKQKDKVLLTGDFNCENDESVVKLLGLRDSLQWDTKSSTFGSFVEVDPSRCRLDFILGSEQVQIVSSGISRYTYPGPNSEPRRPSDHDLVWCAIKTNT